MLLARRVVLVLVFPIIVLCFSDPSFAFVVLSMLCVCVCVCLFLHPLDAFVRFCSCLLSLCCSLLFYLFFLPLACFSFYAFVCFSFPVSARLGCSHVPLLPFPSFSLSFFIFFPFSSSSVICFVFLFVRCVCFCNFLFLRCFRLLGFFSSSFFFVFLFRSLLPPLLLPLRPLLILRFSSVFLFLFGLCSLIVYGLFTLAFSLLCFVSFVYSSFCLRFRFCFLVFPSAFFVLFSSVVVYCVLLFILSSLGCSCVSLFFSLLVCLLMCVCVL